MRSWLLATLLLAGCNKLLDLEHVDNPARRDGDIGDGIDFDPDAPDAETPADGALECPPAVQHDEDNDLIDDRCDACPTITSTLKDTDGDGLPNECDPDLAGSGGDAILLAALFRDPADIAKFTAMGGAAWDPSGDGKVVFAASASLRTNAAYQATRIEVKLSGVTATAGGEIDVTNTGIVQCLVTPTDCGTGAGTCASVVPATTGTGDIGSPMSGLSLIRFGLFPSGTACDITVAGAMVGGQSATVLGNDTYTISTNASATANVRNVVIYGAKL